MELTRQRETFLRFVGGGLPEIGRLKHISLGGSGAEWQVVRQQTATNKKSNPWVPMVLSRLTASYNNNKNGDVSEYIKLSSANHLWLLGDDSALYTALIDGKKGEQADQIVGQTATSATSVYTGSISEMSDSLLINKFLFGTFFNGVGTFEDPSYVTVLLATDPSSRDETAKIRSLPGNVKLMNVGGILVIKPLSDVVDDIFTDALADLNMPVTHPACKAMVNLLSALTLPIGNTTKKTSLKYETVVNRLVTLHGRFQEIGIETPVFNVNDFHSLCVSEYVLSIFASLNRCAYDYNVIPSSEESSSLAVLAMMMGVLSSPGSLDNKAGNIGQVITLLVDNSIAWRVTSGAFLYGNSSIPGVSVNFSDTFIVDSDSRSNAIEDILIKLKVMLFHVDGVTTEPIDGPISHYSFGKLYSLLGLGQGAQVTPTERGRSKMKEARKLLSLGRFLWKYGRYLL